MTTAEGMIYSLNHQGVVSLLEITADGFDIVSQFDLPKNANIARTACVMGGTIASHSFAVCSLCSAACTNSSSLFQS